MKLANVIRDASRQGKYSWRFFRRPVDGLVVVERSLAYMPGDRWAFVYELSGKCVRKRKNATRPPHLEELTLAQLKTHLIDNE